MNSKAETQVLRPSERQTRKRAGSIHRLADKNVDNEKSKRREMKTDRQVDGRDVYADK